MARLLYGTPDGEREVQLGDVCLIGRLPSSQVLLAHDQKVGREHARIRRDETGFVLEDLNSRNGTFLERGYSVIQVMTSTSLQNDDVIRISSARLRFVDSSHESVQAEHAPLQGHVVGMSVEPVASDVQPTVFRDDTTITRDGLPAPPPAAALEHANVADESPGELRAEIQALRDQLAALTKKLSDVLDEKQLEE